MSGQGVEGQESRAPVVTNVTATQTLRWDCFAGRVAGDALREIYAHANDQSNRARGWYWRKIARHRQRSIAARWVIYGLVAVGVAAPIVAAMFSRPEHKLVWTQAGVVALALAAVLQLGDKVFGWSSGWLRYISTVTTMERLNSRFEMEWAAQILGARGVLGDDCVRPLFDLALRFQDDIEKCQADETAAWVTEFNQGIAALNEMIRVQREAADKATQEARSALAPAPHPEARGAIKAHIVRKDDDSKPIQIFLDGIEKESVPGESWAATGVSPGLHTLKAVLPAEGANHPPRSAQGVAKVPPGDAVTIELVLA